MRLDEFCRRVASIDDRVNTALVMKDVTPEGAYARPGQWVPDKELLQRLLTQVNIMIGIAYSNEQIYGRLGYVMVTHSTADFFFFPLADRRIFLASINRPYDHAKIEAGLAEMLSELKNVA
jgi:hypothetical protein